uniref:Uncharacterized protein n=1 Tax=Vitis vinifera TaxID=29760 RepID=A5AYU4_VITVI|nr:hypothetical protein VITISV_008901 [Vitis vinifera]
MDPNGPCYKLIFLNDTIYKGRLVKIKRLKYSKVGEGIKNVSRILFRFSVTHGNDYMHDKEFVVMTTVTSTLLSIMRSVLQWLPLHYHLGNDDSPNNASVSSSSSLQRTSSSEFDRLELYKAVLNGDWESTSQLLVHNPRLFSARFGTDDSPVLHIAVELGEARMGFVEKLVEFMGSEDLALRDSDGATALFNAARAGNIKAVKLLENKNPRLPNICNRYDFAPLHTAVKYGHKELTLYLLSVTRDNEPPYPFSNSPGIELLRRALMVGFHDVALYLVERYPDLATCHFDSAPHNDANDSDEDFTPLTVLAKRPWAFRSGSRFKLRQLIIYHC